MSQTPVPVVSPPGLPAPQEPVCDNCGAVLTGEYCAACGQRHEPHVHAVAHFAGEAFESISHADSRLWSTLWLLLSRPGFLTREFFDGRRARYLPPFRLYLVISVVFFLVAGVPKGPAIEIDDTPETAAAAGSEAANPPNEDADSEGGVQVTGLKEFCDEFKDQPDSDNNARNHLRENCRKLTADKGKALGESIVHNLPRAMFIFLPLIALIMKLMYWRPKRYYVEHLLLLVHNHAFVFLLFAVLLLVRRIPYVNVISGWLWAAGILYMMWYIYRGMRRVYEQGRALTLAKYFALGFAYFWTTLVMLLLTTLYSAMTA